MKIDSKVFYWSNSLIPSNRANAVNVVNSSYELSKISANFKLFCLRNYKESWSIERIYKNYDVGSFRIEGLPYVPLKGWGTIYNIISTIRVFLLNRKTLIITRKVSFAKDAIRMGFSVYFELHQEAWLISKKAKSDLNWLVQHKRCAFGTNSQELKKRMIKEFGMKSSNVVSLPNGAHLSNAVMDTEYVQSLIPEVLYKTNFIVGYSGSLLPGKGIELVIEIANLTQVEDIKYIVIGGTKEEVAICQKRSTRNNILFLGWQPHGRVQEILKVFHVCLLPNQKNMKTGKKSLNTAEITSPIKLFEYMAAGKPILASNIQVLSEVLMPSFSYQHEVNDPKGWLNSLLKLKSDKQLYNKMSQTVLKEFEEKYTWAKRAEKLSVYINESNILRR